MPHGPDPSRLLPETRRARLKLAGRIGAFPSLGGVAGVRKIKKKGRCRLELITGNISGPPYSCGQWAIEIQETGSPQGPADGTGDGIETGLAGD